MLPLDGRGNVYLIKEYHYAIERENLEAVSGGIDKNENVLDAAKRELKEETGMVADDWTDLGYIDPLTTVISSKNYMFLVRKLTFNKPDPEEGERVKVIKIPFKKALGLAMESKITHGATVAVILKAYYYLERRKSL